MPKINPFSPVLFVDGEYRIESFCEDARLVWSGGSIDIGHHYGEPGCALINADAGWCVTGGEGLVICHFEGGLPKGPTRFPVERLKNVKLWRPGNPPPSGAHDYWSVEGIWFYQNDLIRVVVNPLDEHAGLYEVDVKTLVWHKI
jgi:hypothetical protein